ncbi:DUF6711 family protein [Paenibacillus thailandensis]|uniref:DUF6711 family protein n=1 Tax=Paenibacillus thailandensis TaxID=393250 RepID=A0ABW5QSW5_9BACL
MAHLIKVQGLALPTPSDYSVTVSEISNAERNARGDILKEHITYKRKISLGWKFMTQEDIQRAFSYTSENFFNVTYIDPELGETTKTFYAGDRSAGALDFLNGVVRWKDFKFNIIER